MTPKDESELSISSGNGNRFVDQAVTDKATATSIFPRHESRVLPALNSYDSASGLGVTTRFDQWAGASDDTIEEDVLLSVAAVGIVLGRSEREMITERLEDAIDAAREILAWGDNWDGEGSPGYAEATLDRARYFLITGAQLIWDSRRFSLVAPKVTAGPDGSIDLHWRDPACRMLLNVPPDMAEALTYYGRDDEDGEIKGQLQHGADTTHFFAWVARPR